MKFSLTQKKLKDIEQFHNNAWREQDNEYFGKKFYWKHEEYTLALKEKKTVLGVIKFAIDEDVVFVSSLIVDKSYRGEGVGKKLMEEMEKFAKENGCHKVHLYTGKGWPTEKFYKRLGYEKTSELKKHYLKRDFVEYSKFLS